MMKTLNTQKSIRNLKTILLNEFKKSIRAELGYNSNLEKSIESKKLPATSLRIAILANDYVENIILGRRKGARFPNVGRLRDYIKRRNIIPTIELKGSEETRTKSLTYLIGKSIRDKGIKPKKFLDVVDQKLAGDITKKLFEAYEKDLLAAINQPKK